MSSNKNSTAQIFEVLSAHAKILENHSKALQSLSGICADIEFIRTAQVRMSKQLADLHAWLAEVNGNRKTPSSELRTASCNAGKEV